MFVMEGQFHKVCTAIMSDTNVIGRMLLYWSTNITWKIDFGINEAVIVK